MFTSEHTGANTLAYTNNVGTYLELSLRHRSPMFLHSQHCVLPLFHFSLYAHECRYVKVIRLTHADSANHAVACRTVTCFVHQVPHHMPVILSIIRSVVAQSGCSKLVRSLETHSLLEP